MASPSKDQLENILTAFAAKGKGAQDAVNAFGAGLTTNMPVAVMPSQLTYSSTETYTPGWRQMLENTPLPPVNPGMMQAAEQALAQEQERVAREAQREKARWAFRHAQQWFMESPDAPSFGQLIENCQADVSFTELYQFVENVLRPQGIDRTRPFVRCSWGDDDDADTLDFEDTKEKIKMATTSILTPPGSASFLNLQKPRAVVVGGEPRFSLTIIFNKEQQARPEFKKLQMGIDAALKEKWPAKLPPNLKSPFHDGMEKEGQYSGYHAGDIFISPWSKNQPGAINARKEDIIDWSEFYAGWLVRANVRPFAYDQGGNKGCGLFLDSVQFLKPGPRLDGRKPATESFPDDEFSGEEMV